jgi:hypothetical protein
MAKQEKKKRTLCWATGCQELWAFHVKILVGETDGSQTVEGKWCKSHMDEKRDKYVEFFNKSLDCEYRLARRALSPAPASGEAAQPPREGKGD